ncbi:MAG: COX15/CtaA family protein [Bdellovibrionota bacterium]
MRLKAIPQEQQIKKLWCGILVATYFVLLWGTFVRVSRSGSGCGTSWPDCQGTFWIAWDHLPQIIEYIHRATSGLYGIVALVAVLWTWRASTSVLSRLLAFCFLGFVFLEAWIGRALVLQEYVVDDHRLLRMIWMGMHFLNTLCLTGNVMLLWKGLDQAWTKDPRALQEKIKKIMLRPMPVFFLGLCLFGIVTSFYDSSIVVPGKSEWLVPAWVKICRNIHPFLALAFVGFVMWQLVRQAHDHRGKSWMYLAWVVVLNALIGLSNVFWHHWPGLQVLHVLCTHLIWLMLVLYGLEHSGSPSQHHECSGS